MAQSIGMEHPATRCHSITREWHQEVIFPHERVQHLLPKVAAAMPRLNIFRYSHIPKRLSPLDANTGRQLRALLEHQPGVTGNALTANTELTDRLNN